MDTTQHELYEYARLRLKQKKGIYFHFIVFVLGNLLFLSANKLLGIFPQTDWYLWIFSFWVFLFTLHFIRVFITDSFMNKKWERTQIDKLIAQQERKLEQLEQQIKNQQ